MKSEAPAVRALGSVVLAAAITCTAPGCGTGADGDAIRPARIDSLTLNSKKFALPAGFKAAKGVHIGGVKNVGTLVGSSSGLYQAGSGVLKVVDAEAVVGITVYDTAKLAVARAKRIDLWGKNGVEKTAIYKDLDGTDVTAIASKGTQDLWIGTKAKLWRKLLQQNLLSFPTFKDVAWIGTYQSAQAVVVRNGAGALNALYQAKDQKWEQLPLSAPRGAGSFIDIFPTPDGKYLGNTDSGLYRRVYPSDDVVWRAFRFDPDDDGNERGGVQLLAADPVSGTTWVVTGISIFRLNDTVAGRVARPAGLGKVTAASVSTDGSLWVSDGKAVHQLTTTSAALPTNVTYAKHIVPWMDDNCKPCHYIGGTARRLDSYDALVKNLDSAVTQVETGKMPDNKKPLVGGDVALLKKWRTQGKAK